MIHDRSHSNEIMLSSGGIMAIRFRLRSFGSNRVKQGQAGSSGVKQSQAGSSRVKRVSAGYLPIRIFNNNQKVHIIV